MKSRGFWVLLMMMVIICPLKAQEHIITIDQPPVLQADAGPDLTIDYIQGVRLGAVPPAIYGYGNYTYLWEPADQFADPTQSNPIVYPEKTTTYTLTVTDGKNCIARDQITIAVKGSGIDEVKIKPELFIFPNPTSGWIEMKISGIEGKCQFQIINALGQTMLSEQLSVTYQFSDERDLSSFKKGFYFIRLSSADEVIIKSLYIN